jgi:hypothetical protein
MLEYLLSIFWGSISHTRVPLPSNSSNYTEQGLIVYNLTQVYLSVSLMKLFAYLLQKHHTDSVTGEVKAELSEGVEGLNTKLDSIMDTITVLKS